MNEREKILEFTISEYETYQISLEKLCKELDIAWQEEYEARR